MLVVNWSLVMYQNMVVDHYLEKRKKKEILLNTNRLFIKKNTGKSMDFMRYQT